MRDTQQKNLRADPLSCNGGMVARLYLGFLTWDAFPFSAHMYAAVWGIATLATCEAREVLLSSSTHAAPRCRSLRCVQPFLFALNIFAGPKQAPGQCPLLAMLALLGTKASFSFSSFYRYSAPRALSITPQTRSGVAGMSRREMRNARQRASTIAFITAGQE